MKNLHSLKQTNIDNKMYFWVNMGSHQGLCFVDLADRTTDGNGHHECAAAFFNVVTRYAASAETSVYYCECHTCERNYPETKHYFRADYGQYLCNLCRDENHPPFPPF